ncbi:hypothetical protein QO002_003889 [Pararhizobium capsulatum DSM 1112]|uniref:Transcription regulator n=1 Tax=Pararhizobium capsulatum DSM 1112 TaxID=1121113 RepID=A0ABU0BU36_9HYPH|nr:hypothetical protein [Pararhizobium capsulatum]MDQ0321751.1 hypothetical protein [Pararhizobium capsulatum DSM 1112]
MADFVAVIRRTVDGLSDNVPEMRSKVYEKARSAVRRQLESMKPRPSDHMIERQMTKLEAAINEVESDYDEALPAIEDADFAPEAAAAVYHEPVVQEPEPAPSEAAAEYAEPAEPEPVAEAEPEPASEPEQIEAAEDQAPIVEPAPQHDPGVEEAYAEPVTGVLQDAPEYTEAEAYHDTPVAPEPEWSEPETADASEPFVSPEHHASAEDHDVVSIDEEEPVSAPVEAEPAVEVEPVDTREHQAVEDVPFVQSEEPWQEPASVEPVEMPSVEDTRAEAEAPIAGSEWDLPEWEQQAPMAASAVVEPVWTERASDDADGKVVDLADYMPPESAAGGARQGAPTEPSHSWEWDDSDPFQQPTKTASVEGSEPAVSDWSWPVEKPVTPEAPAGLPTAHWDDIDQLLDKGEQAQPAATPSVPDPETMAAPARPVSYRVEPRRSGSGLKIAGIAVVLLAALGGSGYAYWLNRDVVNKWVTETVASVTTSAPVSTTPVSTTTETPATSKPATETPAATNTDSAQPKTDVASLDSSATKFTQRLQTDGSEVDSGPAALPTGDASSEAEGKSVAAQTEAGTPAAQANAATTATNPAAGAATTPATGTGQSPTPANVQVPEGAQKMFLYEERLGQSSPTAIEGTVAWSLKEESPGNDAPPEPTVQAQISVPERGLTALMTLKRNTDPSLPASHVIEFVFSLPENFEGGSIDSVQRVSMKQTEQARGDALIAVPAKITDDFHMIALNDYPEAVATNTELLRTRSWVDVPLTYRNGRRALLTLEKGPAGTEAFTKALQAWSRAPAASGQ